MRTLVVCFWISILASGSALADNRAEARKAFAAGQAADKRQEWDKAIEHYMRANDLVPHRFAVYNIAVNHERRQRLREAATWFQRYLSETTDAAERERIQRLIQDLATRWSGLTVTSKPSGARVYVDGVPVGATTYVGTVKGGFHRISVDLDGKRDQRDINAEYGEPQALEFVLRAPDKNSPAAPKPPAIGPQPPPATPNGAPGSPENPIPLTAPVAATATVSAATGTLRVVGAPPAAAVKVDQTAYPSVPSSIAATPGPHTVRVTSAGFADYEARVNVVEDRETVVTVEMPPRDQRRPVGMMLGAGAGLDARGTGVMSTVEAMARGRQMDFGGRLVRFDEQTFVDILARVYAFTGWISPFVAGAYSLGTDDARGYTLLGGVRVDVVDSARITISVLAESGLRKQTVEDLSMVSGTKDITMIPVNAVLMIAYR